jgi:serine/threonine protein phosphatase PrpC
LATEDIPGLAMTRSFGDAVAVLAGVNGESETMEFDLTKNDKIMVIASDGVWEFLTNEFVNSPSNSVGSLVGVSILPQEECRRSS